jgi:ComF family protein
MTPRDLLRTAAQGTLDAMLALALAPVCASCAQPLPSPRLGPVCASCWDSVRRPPPPLCRTCGVPLPSWRVLSPAFERCVRCRRIPPQIDAACAAGRYEGALRDIIHAFKYEGRRTLAGPLGRLMREAAGPLLSEAACVVPVPLHPWRRLRRGFNQAADLAATFELPVVSALARTRATASQSGLTAAARRRNVRGAFRPSRLCRPRTMTSLVRDRVVVLVDDVRTTGATLDACAGVLKQAGAREVRALTVAYAELRGDAAR